MVKHQTSLRNSLDNGVPIYSTVGDDCGLAVGVVLNYIAPPNVIRVCVQCERASRYGSMVCHSHQSNSFSKSKRSRDESDHPFKMPFAPVTNYVTIAFLLMVLVGMWFNDETRISLIVGIIFLAIVVLSYYVLGIGKRTEVRSSERRKLVK